MPCIGLIREGKLPADNRVALTPSQAQYLQKQFPNLQIIVEPSPDRCFYDEEYLRAGIRVDSDLSMCEILLGIKEVPVSQLLAEKTYLFFSHTKKEQAPRRPPLSLVYQSAPPRSFLLGCSSCCSHS